MVCIVAHNTPQFIYRCLCMEGTVKIIELYPKALLLYVIMLLNDYLIMRGQTPKTKASCGTLNTNSAVSLAFCVVGH